jgi:hypothetical protein
MPPSGRLALVARFSAESIDLGPECKAHGTSSSPGPASLQARSLGVALTSL